MVQVRPAEADAYVKAPRHGAVLLFGPDTGLVRERANAIAKSIDQDDPFAAVRLDADELAQDPARLMDEALTVPLFGGRRLIEVRGSTLRNLSKAFEPLLKDRIEALVVVEQGDLKPTSALRKLFERSDHAAAIACYADEGRSLDVVLKDALAEAGRTIEPEARQLLAESLGADRLNTRSELEKLFLYSDMEITLDDVEAIVTQAKPASTDAWVDHVLCGRTAEAARELVRLEDEGVSPVAMALGLQRQVQALQKARAAMDAGGGDAAGVVAKLRPPVPYRRKMNVVQALQRWSGRGLDRAGRRLSTLNHEVRARPEIANALVGTAALALLASKGR